MEIIKFINNLIIKRLKQIFDNCPNNFQIVKINSYKERKKYQLNLSEISSYCVYNKKNDLECIIFIFYELVNNDLYIESGNNYENLKKQKIENIFSKKNLENELNKTFWFHDQKIINWHDILDNTKTNNDINNDEIENNLLFNNLLSGPYYNIYYKRYEKHLKKLNNKYFTFHEILTYIKKNYLSKKIKLDYNQKLAVVKTNEGWSLKIGKKISNNISKKNIKGLNFNCITYFVGIN